MSTTSVPTVAERVQVGAAYLDEHEPGWVDQIDLDVLNLLSSCRCILGQLFGDYDDAAEKLAEGDADPDKRAADLGFFGYAEFAGCDAAVAPEYHALTAAWRELIAARRAGGNWGEDSVPDDEPILCQYPGCGQPIEDEDGWYHVAGQPDGLPLHAATPVYQHESLILPREVFTDPEALVDLLADSAEHHGWAVDRSEHTRSTLLLWARTLPQILIPADPDATEDQPKGYCPDCKDDVDNHYPCRENGCGCTCMDSATPEHMKRPPQRAGS